MVFASLLLEGCCLWCLYEFECCFGCFRLSIDCLFGYFLRYLLCCGILVVLFVVVYLYWFVFICCVVFKLLLFCRWLGVVLVCVKLCVVGASFDLLC